MVCSISAGALFMDELFKSIKEGIMTEKKETKDTRLYFSTGSTLLDLVVGGGEKAGFGMGYEAGTIVRDWGGSSSTKTFKAVELIAANHYMYKDSLKWVYDDCEGGNKMDTQALYGFDLFPDGRTSSQTVEEWEYNVSKFLSSLKKNEMGIYVLDSLDGLSSDATEERKDLRHKAYDKGKEFDEGTFGMNAAKFLSQEMFKGLAAMLAEKNALLYVISQERDNLNATGYQKKNRLGGGRAIGFYETARIYSKQIEKIEKQGRAVESIIKIIAEKTRHPRPFRSCMVNIKYDWGMDNIGSCIDFLFDCRSDKTGELLKKAGNIPFQDKEWSRDELITYVYQQGLQKEIIQKTIDKWEGIEDEIKTDLPRKYSVVGEV